MPINTFFSFIKNKQCLLSAMFFISVFFITCFIEMFISKNKKLRLIVKNFTKKPLQNFNEKLYT
jgi:hypothetical protein